MKRLLWLAVMLALAATWGGSASAQDMSFSKAVTVYLYGADDNVPLSKAVTVYLYRADDNVPLSKAVTVYLYRADDNVPVSKAVTVYGLGAADQVVPLSKAITVEIGSVVYGDPWSKAVTVCVPPYTLQDAASAMRLAAGLGTALPATRERYDVVVVPPSGRRVDILDACYIAIMAVNAPPPCQ